MEINPKIPDQRYLKFFELFNAQEFFEAHEVLENLWREEKGADRDFYQGLIQIAAAFVHVQKGNEEGVQNLLGKAKHHLSKYPAQHGGLNLPMILAEAANAAKEGRFPTYRPEQ